MSLATSQFAAGFASRPAAAASAPGRVNLIGEHTDYNGGAAVELRTRRAAPAGARVAIASTVPVGAGLSSSAALTVAAARVLSHLAGRRLDRAALVDVAFHAEHDQVGVRCGRMDQTIAAHARRGTALLFETGLGTIEPVPFPGRLWIVETGVSHRLTGGALNERRRECEEALELCRRWRPGLRWLAELAPADLPEVARRLPPPLVPRVRHVVTETGRTRAAARALAAGDLAAVGRLLVEGHESLRADYHSTVPEADFLVERAVAYGAYGARLTGAGWGGAVLVLAPADSEIRIVAELARDFADRFGRTPEAWSTRASAGVRREALPAAAG